MDEFQAYRYYLALKLHFTTDKYDVFKTKGRTKATRAALEKKGNSYFTMKIRKLAKRFGEKDLINYLVANFITGDKHGGVFSGSAEEIYDDWIKRNESLHARFDADLSTLIFECEKKGMTFDDCFECDTGNHPLILKFLLSKQISHESCVLLDYCRPFISEFDDKLNNDIIWNDISRSLKKYKPFVKFNKEVAYDKFLSRTT